MNNSVFDLLKPGVGPSNSHTMGPMTAARRCLALLDDGLLLAARVEIRLYGSLALTGRGHATVTAVLLGLSGFEPSTFDPDKAWATLSQIRSSGLLPLGGTRLIQFDEHVDVLWCKRERLPQHPHALSFTAWTQTDEPICSRTYFSVGGGFVRDENEMALNSPDQDRAAELPHAFDSAAALLDHCSRSELTIAEIARANERVWRTDVEIDHGLDAIVEAMDGCIDRGMLACGELPGELKVRRRARQVHANIMARAERPVTDPLAALGSVPN